MIKDIHTKELLTALSTAAPAVATTDTSIEWTKDFFFLPGRIMAYNRSIRIVVPFDHGLAEDVSVSAEHALWAASGIKDETVRLSMDKDAKTVNLESGSTKIALAANKPDEEFLAVLNEDTKEGGWLPLKEGFKRGLELCLFSVDRRPFNSFLNTVYVGKGKIMTTDGLRASRYTVETPLDVKLPFHGVKELLKMPVIAACKDGQSWVHFTDSTEKGALFSVRKVDCAWPVEKCEAILALEGPEITLPPELADAAKHALVFAPGLSKETKMIEVSLAKGRITVKSGNTFGGIKRVLKVPDLDPPKGLSVLSVNPVFLSEVMKRATVMRKEGDRVLFLSEDGFRHVFKIPLPE